MNGFKSCEELSSTKAATATHRNPGETAVLAFDAFNWAEGNRWELM